MLLEWDMSGLRLRRGRCTGTVDLLTYNTSKEELIMKSEADITLQFPTVEAFECLVLLRYSRESIHKV
jgi:hypothetical protein